MKRGGVSCLLEVAQIFVAAMRAMHAQAFATCLDAPDNNDNNHKQNQNNKKSSKQVEQ